MTGGHFSNMSLKNIRRYTYPRAIEWKILDDDDNEDYDDDGR
jgi:hypothetical protein